mmetsp:Transcript_4624/g.13941  ORF Transcript_4624/g.13941 Transcript_4624/m.13941 type:complete len:206 (-) Transcript_4624:1617-2234(-)
MGRQGSRTWASVLPAPDWEPTAGSRRAPSRRGSDPLPSSAAPGGTASRPPPGAAAGTAAAVPAAGATWRAAPPPRWACPESCLRSTAATPDPTACRVGSAGWCAPACRRRPSVCCPVSGADAQCSWPADSLQATYTQAWCRLARPRGAAGARAALRAAAAAAWPWGRAARACRRAPRWRGALARVWYTTQNRYPSTGWCTCRGRR